jgi:hypothetical protein
VRDSLRAANRAKQDKREHAYDEPWLLVTSLSAEQASAEQVVASYRRRMQIELTFRDLKDDRWSMAFTEARTYSPERREMLLLIAAVGTFALWLIGLVAESLDWQRHFQANTVRDRRVLSVIFLAKEVYRNSNYELFPQLLSAALELLRVSTVQSLDPITISGDR